jgi:hypothetical protein
MFNSLRRPIVLTSKRAGKTACRSFSTLPARHRRAPPAVLIEDLPSARFSSRMLGRR